MGFDSELESFRAFAKLYPDNAILLIDTYDTLGSGIDNAIIVGLEQKAKGLPSIGVRIDSGDMSYLPKMIRKKLDDAGLPDAKICVSNDMTEEIIQTLMQDEVPIDSWGIGTHLVTGGFQSSLNGVYKLCAKQPEADKPYIPTMKLSNSFGKTTNPGIKQVWRFYDKKHTALADLITLEDEKVETGKEYTFYHPFSDTDFFRMKGPMYNSCVPLLSLKIKGGKTHCTGKDIATATAICKGKPCHVPRVLQTANQSAHLQGQSLSCPEDIETGADCKGKDENRRGLTNKTHIRKRETACKGSFFFYRCTYLSMASPKAWAMLCCQAGSSRCNASSLLEMKPTSTKAAQVRQALSTYRSSSLMPLSSMEGKLAANEDSMLPANFRFSSICCTFNVLLSSEANRGIFSNGVFSSMIGTCLSFGFVKTSNPSADWFVEAFACMDKNKEAVLGERTVR
jgi:hypothetical protein